MPLALVILATLLFIVGFRGNYDDAGKLFNQTFFSQGNQSGFGVWFGSILGLAVIFRVIGAPRAGELFVSLVLVVFILRNPGVIGQIQAALNSIGQQQATAASGASGAGNGSGTSAPAPASQSTAPAASGNPVGSFAPMTGGLLGF